MENVKREITPVNCSRGAPMGRWEHAEIIPAVGSVECFAVRINSGGYDAGGAYWGLSDSERLFCLCQPDHEQVDGLGRRVYFRVFVRAKNRQAAVDRSGLAYHMLKRRPAGFVADKRFTCALEYCGAAAKKYVLRFCGDYVDAFDDIETARRGAAIHARNWNRK